LNTAKLLDEKQMILWNLCDQSILLLIKIIINGRVGVMLISTPQMKAEGRQYYKMSRVIEAKV
jgi:hypothetical protein